MPDPDPSDALSEVESDFDVYFVDDDGAERRRYKIGRDARHRLDKYLQNRIKSFSRNQVQKLIDLGGVKVNGKLPKASTRLREGDVLELILPPRPASYLVPEPIAIDILYEDDDFIVLNKQAGIIVHPARSNLQGTLLNALAWHFAQGDPTKLEAAADRTDLSVEGLSEVGKDEARPGVVHRLDKNTTGVIVVAKRDETHWMLARQFEQRTNLKCYLALVHGCPEPPAGVIDAPIGKHPTIREAMAVRQGDHGRASVTIYRVRERYEGYSLVELELKTGRTHQIRVHLSYLGHPIIGDIIYGGEPIGEAELLVPPHPAGSRMNLNFARTKEQGVALEQHAQSRCDLLLAHPALHAALLQLRHPRTQEVMTFTAPLHEPVRSLVHRLRERPAPGEVVNKGTHVDLTQAIPA